MKFITQLLLEPKGSIEAAASRMPKQLQPQETSDVPALGSAEMMSKCLEEVGKWYLNRRLQAQNEANSTGRPVFLEVIYPTLSIQKANEGGSRAKPSSTRKPSPPLCREEVKENRPKENLPPAKGLSMPVYSEKLFLAHESTPGKIPNIPDLPLGNQSLSTDDTRKKALTLANAKIQSVKKLNLDPRIESKKLIKEAVKRGEDPKHHRVSIRFKYMRHLM